MYLCYIDESGTSNIPGNTSHFILAGLSIPIWHWNVCERDISIIKQKYSLVNAEIHTAWLARKYLEQNKIADLCSFAIRRYLENNEDELFDLVFMRAHRKHDLSVGVRHFSKKNCSCKICAEHTQTLTPGTL